MEYETCDKCGKRLLATEEQLHRVEMTAPPGPDCPQGYASEVVLGGGFKWGPQWLAPRFALMADMGPPAVEKAAGADRANSPNHEGLGQNVLYADGSVEFRPSPLAGIDDDHIYRTRLNLILDSPQDATDSILLPIQQ